MDWSYGQNIEKYKHKKIQKKGEHKLISVAVDVEAATDSRRIGREKRKVCRCGRVETTKRIENKISSDGKNVRIG